MRILRFKPRDLAAFAAGAATVLAFAPFSQGYVAIAGLAVLFLLWDGETDPRSAFRTGWLWGLGLLGFGVFWLHVSIDQFGSVGTVTAVVITLIFIALMALYFGLAGGLLVRFSPHPSFFRLVLLVPAVWVLGEWVRGWFLTGFPWLLMGYAPIDLPLAGFAPVTGVYGLSWGMALTAAVLVAMYRYRSGMAAAAMVVVLLLWGGGYLLRGMAWSVQQGPPLKVSLMQGDIPQHKKWDRAQLVPTLETYLGMTMAHWDSDLVIWPETAVPAFLDQVEENFIKPLAKAAREHDTLMLFGVPVYDTKTGAYYNAMLGLGRQGRDLYYKRHLVPFGEFLPMRWLLAPLHPYIAVPMADFSSGKPTKPLVRLDSLQAGVSICYEDAFGNEVIRALPEADFLVNASNDAWFGDSLAPYQHLEIARMRALETGRYLLRATNTGISAVIDPKGKVVGSIPFYKRGVLTREIHAMRGYSPYAQWGNTPVILAVFSMAIGGVWLGRRRSVGR